MRLVFISDTHTYTGFPVPDGDVLIHAGDATSTGTPDEVALFLDWFSDQPHPRKILIAGNHDWLFQENPDLAALMLAEHPGLTYLQDAGTEINGVRFWGSPWQPWFNAWAFNLPSEGESLRNVWNRIPMDTEVLITHGPPRGILDTAGHGLPPLGCKELRKRLAMVRPRIHAFGHIHGGYGAAQSETTLFLNASICDEAYRPNNRPIVVELNEAEVKVVGADPSPRRARLDAIRAILEAAQGNPAEVQALQIQAALQAMAEVRGMTLADLMKDYGRRGLHADLGKLARAENQHCKRPIPIQFLKG